MPTSNDSLQVLANNERAGELLKEHAYVFRYQTRADQDSFVSLTMPVRASTYQHSDIFPIFEMHLPEGYLLSVINRQFSKLIGNDDLSLLKLLSPAIRGRLTYKAESELPAKHPLNLDDLLSPEEGLFEELVERFALRSAVSGVQPKVLVKVQDKATLQMEDYIVKTWGDDFPQLALNEYWCMQVVKAANIPVPEFYISEDARFFIMKRFDITETGFLGFEDMCVLQGKGRDDKYEGSCEQLIKTITQFVSPQHRREALKNFFKITVLNHRLENGDAHLKNFGVLYQNIHNIKLAPAYDVVSTTAYIKQDMAALTLMGSRKWWPRKHLITFGMQHCGLTLHEANGLYDECLIAIEQVSQQIKIKLQNELPEEQQQMLEHLLRLMKKADARQ